MPSAPSRTSRHFVLIVLRPCRDAAAFLGQWIKRVWLLVTFALFVSDLVFSLMHLMTQNCVIHLCVCVGTTDCYSRACVCIPVKYNGVCMCRLNQKRVEQNSDSCSRFPSDGCCFSEESSATSSLFPFSPKTWSRDVFFFFFFLEFEAWRWKDGLDHLSLSPSGDWWNFSPQTTHHFPACLSPLQSHLCVWRVYIGYCSKS